MPAAPDSGFISTGLAGMLDRIRRVMLDLELLQEVYTHLSVSSQQKEFSVSPFFWGLREASASIGSPRPVLVPHC